MKVIFSHGKETGPRGHKITYLAEIAKTHGYEVDSIDYRASQDPEWRVKHLLEQAGKTQGLVLVGSSMGAYVSTVAASQLQAKGLFLMAPAFYLPGYEQQDPQAPKCPVTIVHGWSDEVVPFEHAIRFAQQFKSSLHILNSDHGLGDALQALGELFGDFLRSLS
jgi:predicted esterase